MSAFDIAGAVAGTILAAVFYIAGLVPNQPPKDPYDSNTASSLLAAIACTGWVAFCVARMFGATL